MQLISAREWKKQLGWWRAARFGMFIHWGPVSLKGTEIGWSRGTPEVSIDEYDNLFKRFNPTRFNADEWVNVAKDAGMKYIVLTTKHHDGFCLWDTKQTDYNIMNSPFKRDVVKELSAACRRQGIAFGAYYSVCDWHHPAFPHGSPGGTTLKPNPDLDAYTDYLLKQVGELITNYGPLVTLWFDGAQDFDKDRGELVIHHARSFQPDIIINNRTGGVGELGDYDTPEQHIGAFNISRPWETCMTICEQWAWKPDDQMKSLKDCLHGLIFSTAGDGNFLFNVGPMPDGRIEPRQVERLKEMGQWMTKYGESIYGTRGGPYKPFKGRYACTRKDNIIYLHIAGWDGAKLVLPPLPKKITGSSLLTGGKVEVKQTDRNITITVPTNSRREIDTIVKLEIEGKAMEIEPIKIIQTMKATASSVGRDAADNAIDGETDTYWTTAKGVTKAWIKIDFGRKITFNEVSLGETIRRVKKFKFEYQKGKNWKTAFAGTVIGVEPSRNKFAPVTARYVRLNILEALDRPRISLIEISPIV